MSTIRNTGAGKPAQPRATPSAQTSGSTDKPASTVSRSVPDTLATRDAANTGALTRVRVPEAAPSDQDESHTSLYAVMAKDTPDTPVAIVKFTEDAAVYQKLGHKVFRASDQQIATRLILKPTSLYKVLDDQAWAALSGQLLQEARRQRSQPRKLVGLRPTPLDLPPDIAVLRLSFLEQHPDKGNAQTLYELIEVLRVSEGRNPLMRGYFSHESYTAPFWAVTEHTSLDTLHTRTDELRQEVVSLKRSATPDAPLTALQQRAIDAHLSELAELAILMDNHPASDDDEPESTP